MVFHRLPVNDLRHPQTDIPSRRTNGFSFACAAVKKRDGTFVACDTLYVIRGRQTGQCARRGTFRCWRTRPIRRCRPGQVSNGRPINDGSTALCTRFIIITRQHAFITNIYTRWPVYVYCVCVRKWYIFLSKSHSLLLWSHATDNGVIITESSPRLLK